MEETQNPRQPKIEQSEPQIEVLKIWVYLGFGV
jgi:hypothetical protein